MSHLHARAFAVFSSVACISACSDKSTSGSGGGTDASVVDGSRNGTDGSAGGGSDASSQSDGGSSYCSKDSQCMMGQTCLSGATPGGTTPFGCGAQPQNMCMTDDECADASGAAPDGGAMIVCIAASGCQGSHCGPGCTADGECGTAQACKLGHCIVKPCTGDMDCPDNYSCQSNACAIKPCTQDADCKGYCVDAQCAGAPGGCTTLVGVP
jgi:hypothetical protein